MLAPDHPNVPSLGTSRWQVGGFTFEVEDFAIFNVFHVQSFPGLLEVKRLLVAVTGFTSVEGLGDGVVVA